MRAAPGAGASRGLPPGVWIIAGLVVLLHIAASGDWAGWEVFRDEFYFLACGRRLAAGYVDQPPLVAFFARAAERIAGGPEGALWRLRLLPFLAHGATVLLTARVALGLGARPLGAMLAAGACASASTLLVTGHLLTMNALEPLLWTGLGALVLRAVQEDDARPLVPAGALLGLGVLNKFSVAFWVASLLVGLLLTPARRLLLTRAALAGAALAALVAAPTIAWQALHGWPQLELLRNAAAYKNAITRPGQFFAGQLPSAGPVALVLALAGLAELLARPRARALGLAALACALLLGLTGGKPYYFAPALPLLLAAAGAGLERLRSATAVGAVALGLLAAQAALVAAVGLPLLPPARTAALLVRLGLEEQRLERKRYNALPQHLADSVGWKNLVREVAAASARIPLNQRPAAAIFTQNYGEAGALEWYGRGLGLPVILGAHNHYWLWSEERIRRGPPVELALIVGERAEELARLFEHVERVGTARSEWAMPYESELPLWRCSGWKLPLAELWPRLRHYE